jgi:potassium efflux system protein
MVDILGTITDTLSHIWHYTIITTSDKEMISFGNIVTGIILFIFGLRVARKLSVLLRKRLLEAMDLEPTVVGSLEKLLHYLLIVFVTLLVLDISHVPLTVFTFVGGALAIGIGFGSQNILNNFISGLIIMVEQPIRVGDYIEMPKKSDIVGRVINIGARCTNLRTTSNIDVLVPNSAILQNTIVNLTLSDPTIRVSTFIPLDMNQETPSERIQEILLDIMYKHPLILKDPKPEVFLSFERGAMQFELSFWIDMFNMNVTRKQIISDINHAAKADLQKSGVVFISGLHHLMSG